MPTAQNLGTVDGVAHGAGTYSIAGTRLSVEETPFSLPSFLFMLQEGI